MFSVVAVLVVAVVSSLSLSIVYSYLFATGTVILNQIQVCSAWRIRVCARVDGLRFVVSLVVRGFVRLVWKFMLSMALIVCFCCMSVLFHCFSQRRVGGSFAPRVSPAVTMLTV